MDPVMMQIRISSRLKCALFTALCTVCFIWDAQAQLSVAAVPSESSTLLRACSDPIELRVPSSAAIESLISAEESSLLRDRYAIALPIDTDLSMQRNGVCRYDSNGNAVWELALRAKGACSLQFFFDQFELPKGSRLFILSPQGEVLKGAFTEANNTRLGTLSTAPVKSDWVVLRYEAPIGSTQAPLLHIASVSYGFRELAPFPAEDKHEKGEPWMRGTYPCAPNIVSLPKLDEVKRSLVLMIVRGTTVCTGALINNTSKDGTAYVLTASHCVNGSFAQKGDRAFMDESARQTVFFFNFYSPIGNKLIRGVEEQSLAGAEIVAIDEAHDLCLLRIVGVEKEGKTASGGIPITYQPYFAGWNATGKPKGPFYGIHCPSASVARYNLCEEESLSLSDFDAGAMVWNSSHFHIKRWDIGTTAGGSSGSPLLDNKLHIIGALTGGKSYCETPINDFYYSIERCFTGSGVDSLYLKPFLDPSGTGATTCDGLDPYAPLSMRLLSHHRYAPWRDSVETVAPPSEIDGLLTAYPIKAKSELHGVILVAETPYADDGALQIVAYAKGADGGLRELYRADYTLPAFQRIAGGGTEFIERTLTGPIATYIPLRNIVSLNKGEMLYIGLETKQGKRLPFVPYRTKATANLSGATLYRTIGSTEYVNSAPYKGYYWIDALVKPNEQPTDSLQTKRPIPTAFVFGNVLRIIIPKNFDREVTASLYTMRGEQLISRTTQEEVCDIVLPETARGDWRVLYLKYGKEHYGMVVYIEP